MASDAFGKITNIAELALIGGILYIGYKFYKDLFPGKTPSTDPKKDGTINTDSANSLLNYIEAQPDKLPGNIDLSNLTPSVNTPLGPVGFGVPSLISGQVAKISNAVSIPFMKGIWEWSMTNKYGAGWQNSMHVENGQWVKNATQPATPQNAPYVARRDTAAMLTAAKSGTLFGAAKVAPAASTASTLAPANTKAASFVSMLRLGQVTAKTPAAPTGTGFVNIADVPKQTFQQTRDYLGKVPNGTPVTNGGQVWFGGIANARGIFATGYGGTGNSPARVYDLLHPPAPEVDPTKGVNGYINPQGSLVATGSTPPAGSTPIKNTNVETKYTPVQPITAYTPAPKAAESIAANPAMGSTPGIVYVNWQNYNVSKVPIQGLGWIQMTEAEAKSRGFIK